MTSTDSFFKRLAIKQPFATGAGSVVSGIGDSTSNNINCIDGFPSVYEAAVSSGGKYVSRGDMNAIGNLASQTQFYFQAGGINEFDQAFATKIGGYPKGAVLDYLVGDKFFKVLSLVENNLIDYTGRSPATGMTTTEGTVDGVNWAYLNQDSVDPRFSVCVLPNQIANASSNVISVFVAPTSGNLFVDGRFSTNSIAQSSIGEWMGAGLFAIEITSSDDISAPTATSGFGGWTPIYSFTEFSINSETGYSAIQTSSFHVTKGNKYAIASACGMPSVASGQQTPLMVFDIDAKVYVV